MFVTLEIILNAYTYCPSFITYLRSKIRTKRRLASSPPGKLKDELTLLLGDVLHGDIIGRLRGGPSVDQERSGNTIVSTDFSHLSVTQVIILFDDVIDICFRTTTLGLLTVKAGRYVLWTGHWERKSKVSVVTSWQFSGTGVPAWHGMVKLILIAKSPPKSVVTSENCKVIQERKVEEDDVYTMWYLFEIFSQILNLWLLVSTSSEHTHTI